MVYGILVLLAELRWRYMLEGWTFLTRAVGRGFLYLFIAADVFSSLSFIDNDGLKILNIVICEIIHSHHHHIHDIHHHHQPIHDC